MGVSIDGGAGTGGGAGRGGRDGGGDADAVEAGTPAPALTWRDLSPCEFPKSAPIDDLTPMLAFDRDRRKLVFYGGHSRNDAIQSPYVFPGPAVGNLWEMDAASGAWVERTSCSPVAYFAGATGAMIYDTQRRLLVVFTGPNGDVGEWDPVTDLWTDRPPAGGSSSAPVGFAHLAVYDEARGKVIVFVVDDEQAYSAWEWEPAAGSWTLRTTDLPLFRDPNEKPGGAYDGDRGVLWLFGGGGGELLDHLWRWDIGDAGSAPVDVTPAVRPAAWPAARFAPGLAYDVGRGRLVLYGGVADDYLRDLWEWDPTTSQWQDRTPAAVPRTGTTVPDGIVWPPAGLDANRIVTDPTGGQVLLYDWPDGEPRWAWDGQAGTWSVARSATPPRWPQGAATATAWNADDGSLLAWVGTDLWRWTPQPEAWELLTPPEWAAVAPASRDPAAWPEPRSDTAIAYDRGAGRLVLFGGLAADGTLDDLWLWDPLTRRMTRSAPPSGGAWPASRSGHALAYDPVGRRVLLFGGRSSDALVLDDWWALDSSSRSWTDLTPPASIRQAAGAAWPPARAQHGFVLDTDRGVLVLAGGYSDDTQLNDVWELNADGSAWTPVANGAAGGNSPVLSFSVPVTFAPGLGLYTVASSNGSETLWRWDSLAHNWTTAGALPRDLESEYILWLAGIDGGLLFLNTNVDRFVAEDSFFFETWRAGPAL